MRSKLLFLLIFFYHSSILDAQNQYNNFKNDNIWIVGSLVPKPDSIWGGAIIDYSSNPPKSYRKNVNIKIDQTLVSYSDNYGNFILASNGREIMDSTLNIMENGTGLEVGLKGYWGNALPQTTLVLEWPNDTNKLAIIYSDSQYEEYKYVCSYNLFYSVIDKRGNNGLGNVTEKNNNIFCHTLSPSHLTACRHANGKDWWIVKNSIYNDTIYKFLFSKEGISLNGFQKVSDNKNLPGLGQSLFSPNGEIFTSLNIVTINETSRYILVYNFDRCSGIFSKRSYFYVDTSKAICGGAAISPNSRFLYVAFTNYVFQYDLLAKDIGASKVTVLKRDLSKDASSSAFFQAQLAPDGKIYISTQNTTTYYHVINYPDKKGDSCMAVQAGFDVKTYYNGTVPNNPNYRLGRLIGSPCDTLFNDSINNTAFIIGTIQTELNEKVESVSLKIDGIEKYLTGYNGTYAIELEKKKDYLIKPVKDIDIRNGVTTADIVAINSHLLGIQPIKSNYKRIAADANNDKRISTSDMVELRKVILYTKDEFTNNTSWKFIDNNYKFQTSAAEQEPYTIENNISNLKSNSVVNYIGVKIGDLNNSAKANNLFTDVIERSTRDYYFITTNLSLKTNEERTIKLKLEKPNELLCYQFTLNFDPNQIDIIHIGGIDADKIGLRLLNQGAITISNENTEQSEIELIVKAKRDLSIENALSIGSRFTVAEGYSTNGEIVKMALKFDTEKAGNFILYQNMPNPFNQKTIISFVLPESSNTNLIIYDALGKIIYSTHGYYTTGYHEIELENSIFSSSGVYSYRFSTEKNAQTKQMIFTQ